MSLRIYVVGLFIRRGALFLFLGGSKGAVLDPPNEMVFAVAELGFRWCLAVFRMHGGKAAFSACPG